MKEWNLMDSKGTAPSGRMEWSAGLDPALKHRAIQIPPLQGGPPHRSPTRTKKSPAPRFHAALPPAAEGGTSDRVVPNRQLPAPPAVREGSHRRVFGIRVGPPLRGSAQKLAEIRCPRWYGSASTWSIPFLATADASEMPSSSGLLVRS